MRLVMAALLLPASLAAQAFDVTPRPTQLDPAAANYTLRATSRIALARGDAELRPAAELLQQVIRSATDWEIPIVAAAADGDIVIERLPGLPGDSETYQLRADPGRVRLQAGGLRGAVWGVQSLRQLLPPEFERDGRGRDWWPIRGAGLRDRPRYAWRGLLLDVARHYLPVAEIRRQIDLMSRYKLNVLHWHLTDDQGWRLEIRRYPRLTSAGAWRTEADGTRYGGFYSQDEVRGVVEYARQRGITVVPEIEMPGHASAAVSAYPELGCTGQPVTIPVTWGVFDDIFCAGNERTFEFLFNVLDEVVALFPSRYIHVGGDEVPKARWQQCAMCQAVMRRENLRDAEQLQSWFMNRIARHLESRGRRAIGWDEILDGGVPPGVAVQVWRDTAAIGRALRSGALVVASPDGVTYLNQSARETPLQRVYAFDPAAGRPADETARILGGEATLWSEYIDAGNIDLMAWPRLLAFAEALWSGPSSYSEFRGRLDAQYARLRAAGVKVGPEDRDVMRVSVGYDSTNLALRVDAQPGIPDAVLRYAIGGGEPTVLSRAVEGTVRFTSGPVVLRTFVYGRPTLNRRRIDFADHLARGRSVTVTAPSRNYPGTGSRTLSDGLLGSDDHHDGLWNGWQGRDVDIIIDLGEQASVSSVEASVLSSPTSWILLPASMTVFASWDGLSWETAGSASLAPTDDRSVRRVRLTAGVQSMLPIRYLRITLANPGPLPAWHAAAGRPSWIFADEILVR